VGLVLAAAACDRERHHQDIRHHSGAAGVIPAKRGKADWPMRGIRAETRQQLPSALYRPRALAERRFSSVKRTFQQHAADASAVAWLRR
jgi:hypothetical protein